jgi:hypothetical protein
MFVLYEKQNNCKIKILPNNNSSQVWFQLAQQFQRLLLKHENILPPTMTDANTLHAI